MITYKSHTVQPGEDFSIIARKYLGNPALWTVIAQANPQYPIRYVGGIPYVTLKVGDVVRVPITVADPPPAPAPTRPNVVDYQDIEITPPPAPNRPTPPPSPPSVPDEEPSSDESSKSESGGGMKWLLLGGLGLLLLAGKGKGRK